MSTRGTSMGRGGRGAYYRSLYARRGRGRGGGHQSPSSSTASNEFQSRGPIDVDKIIGTKDVLERELRKIDGKPYGAYKNLKGILPLASLQFI
jgi:hypothetical protein